MTAASVVMKRWREENPDRDRFNQFNWRQRHKGQKAVYDKCRNTIARNIKQTRFWWGNP